MTIAQTMRVRRLGPLGPLTLMGRGCPGRLGAVGHLTTALAIAGLIATVSAATTAPASADELPAYGTCVGGPFTSTPKPGSPVAPGGIIVYRVILIVEGGPVMGCSRDVRLSSLLEFVSATPDGAYWPATTVGPMAGVSFDGPQEDGAILSGEVTMRVRADAPIRATIEASSGEVIEHVVVRRKHHRNSKLEFRKRPVGPRVALSRV